MLEKLKGSVSYGMTVNRGNYNNERFDATLEFYPDDTDFSTAFDTVKKMVRAKAEIETEAP